MNEIRINSIEGLVIRDNERFVSEWMHASLMNQWLLRIRLKEAHAKYGEESHWVETRERSRAHVSRVRNEHPS